MRIRGLSEKQDPHHGKNDHQHTGAGTYQENGLVARNESHQGAAFRDFLKRLFDGRFFRSVRIFGSCRLHRRLRGAFYWLLKTVAGL